jgi:hypothetical protein
MKPFLFLLLFAFQTCLLAQNPDWVDYELRTTKFPEVDFLTAFASEVVPKGTEASVVYEKLNQITKGQLIESIVVSINSQTELSVNIENTKTDEAFKRSSQSFSSADLVGMKVNNHYDKRKKTAFSFSYVRIEELIEFNQQLLSRNTGTITDNLAKNKSAAKTTQSVLLMENERLQKESQQAINVLRALGTASDDGQLRNFQTQNNASIAALLSTDQVTIPVLVTIMSERLVLQLGQSNAGSIVSGQIGFESSGVESEYSRELNNQLLQAVNKKAGIQLVSKRSENSLKLGGNYRIGNGTVTIVAQLINEENKVITSTEIVVPETNLRTGSFDLLPYNFQYLDELSKFGLTAPGEFTIKPNELLDKAVMVTLTHESYPIKDVPLLLTLDQKKYSISTSDDGVASFFIEEKAVEAGSEYMLNVTLDLANYMRIKPNSTFYEQIKTENSIDEIQIKLNIKAPVIFIDSHERGLEADLSIPIIEPAIKSALSGLNYEFTDIEAEADFVLTVNAATRKGQRGDFAFITYLDATISFKDVASGKEIYKNSYSDVKGIGSNYEVANGKAYQKGKAMIADDISYELEFNQ